MCNGPGFRRGHVNGNECARGEVGRCPNGTRVGDVHVQGRRNG